jgi:hypothetical protein
MKRSLRILMFAVVVTSLAACTWIRVSGIRREGDPPGVGEKAERGFAASQLIIDALEAYREDHGVYPDEAVDLEPGYLPVLWTGGADVDYSYIMSGDDYSFSFHYRGPGMNTCKYKPGAEWHCSGAY